MYVACAPKAAGIEISHQLANKAIGVVRSRALAWSWRHLGYTARVYWRVIFSCSLQPREAAVARGVTTTKHKTVNSALSGAESQWPNTAKHTKGGAPGVKPTTKGVHSAVA